MPNRLIHSTSPYLRQHAHQPVDWYPWGEAALQKAQEEDKPLLVSIGYAACHWCHVMARESFDDAEIGALMNAHFVCVKIDREERPDVDQVYVAALQAMGLPVGWPLHAFLLPDQMPFYGGLYFPPATWRKLLVAVAEGFRQHRPQLSTLAAQLTQALQEAPDGHMHGTIPDVSERPTAQQLFEQIYPQLDLVHGGTRGTPKFPMPSVGGFLLHYYQLTHDESALAQLNRTLEHMACGGIYDQLAGGFARYATDAAWQIPHFEKMLCDNGLLLGLYAQAHAVSPQPLYERIIRETIAFLEHALLHANGGFFSALDADSEGVEGKFYTWTQAEVMAALGPAAPDAMTYFHVTSTGNWRAGVNILHTSPGQSLMPVDQAKIDSARQVLRRVRAQRQPPNRNEQIITSWNAMAIHGLVEAYQAVGEAHWLHLAQQNAYFIEQHLLREHQLRHSCSMGQLSALGYLEDYAWVARAFISLYQATFQERWLHTAQALTQYAIDYCYDSKTGLFYTVPMQNAHLIARLHDLWDGALPSANAVMAHNLSTLGLLLDKPTYVHMAQQMLQCIAVRLYAQPLHMTHWATLWLRQQHSIPVVAVVGTEAVVYARALKQHFPTKILLAGTETRSNLPLLIHKEPLAGQTTIYVCSHGQCLAPVTSVAEAMRQIAEVQG
ncbi:MAG: thioredoxin domain-containing protein [Bacteroidota bacterium]